MVWTLAVVQIPCSSHYVLLLGVCLNPCHFGGGGSLFLGYAAFPPHARIKNSTFFIFPLDKLRR